MKLPSTDTHFKQSDWDNYQLEQYRRARDTCGQHRTAIDCGAHVGIMTHRMCEDYEFVYAIEPQWGEYLNANMRGYRNWRHIDAAVGRTLGRASMSVNHTNTGGTRVTPGTDVAVVTIDSLDFERVDLIKMDLEGAELDALIGAERTINVYRPTLLIELEKNSLQRPTVEGLLSRWGYREQYRKNADIVWRYEGLRSSK